jgi:hypothetical protein
MVRRLRNVDVLEHADVADHRRHTSSNSGSVASAAMQPFVADVEERLSFFRHHAFLSTLKSLTLL